MQPRPGVTQTLARFVADTQWDGIPDPVKHEAKRALLNFFAVALAGCRTGPIELALKSLAEFSGGKQATIIGRSECLGWPAKSVSVGNAARNGLWSALLAEKGFEGPAEPIAGAQGFLAAMGEPPNWAALLDGLGESWEVANNSIKPYPCGFVIHPLLDCALDWRHAHPQVAVERVA